MSAEPTPSDGCNLPLSVALFDGDPEHRFTSHWVLTELSEGWSHADSCVVVREGGHQVEPGELLRHDPKACDEAEQW